VSTVGLYSPDAHEAATNMTIPSSSTEVLPIVIHPLLATRALPAARFSR
jgi:hypothetical protein